MTPSDRHALDVDDLVRILAPGRPILVERVAGDPTADTALASVVAELVAASGATVVPFDRSGARELATAVRLTRASLVLARPDRSSAAVRVVRRTLAYYASRIDVPLATVDPTEQIRLVEPLGRTPGEAVDRGSTSVGRLGEPALS